MTENYHHVQLVIESGELHPKFVCSAPEDANCRRRPADWEEREDWVPSESDIPGHPCWAVEFVQDAGLPDAIYAHPDGVLASVPVSIRYAECVEVTPVTDREICPQPCEHLSQHDAREGRTCPEHPCTCTDREVGGSAAEAGKQP